MYVVRDKKTKAILHMVNSQPGVDLEPKQIFGGFDPKTMEMGRYSEQHLPTEFTIEDGVVKSLEKAASGKQAGPTLEEIKAARLVEASRRSFELRQQLIPEHEVVNAALGVYDEKRAKAIRETVKAFRDAYKKFEAQLGKARSKKEAESLEPDFPKKLLS